MRIFAHLLSEAIGKLASALAMGLLFTAIGAGVVLAYTDGIQHIWPPSPLTIVIAVVIGLLAGYAAMTTALLRAISQTLLGATKAVEQETSKVL